MMRNWEIWTTNIQKSNNNRMLQQLAFDDQKFIPATSVQDLNPRSCADNTHTSIFPFEMTAIKPGDDEIPTRKLTWKLLGFLSHNLSLGPPDIRYTFAVDWTTTLF
jgi:hypothetical protein